MTDGHDAAAANQAPLDWVNMLLADVQGGVGPFLACFLPAIGIGRLVPRKAHTDRAGVRDRGDSCCRDGGVAKFFWPVMIVQVANGAADAVFPAAIAAISLGIVGRARFTARVGRNEAFNHAGNVVTAIAAGAAGWLIVRSAVLWIVAALAVGVWVQLSRVRASDINHIVARGADGGDVDRSDRDVLRAVLCNRPLVAFTAAITLFHFANAAMLPLLGETLAKAHAEAGAPFIAACIITAQMVMVPMAVLVGRRADDWGRKRLLLVGFVALPVRGGLYTLVRDPVALVAIQGLDGIGAGIFGALFPLVVADVTKGSGRYNLAQGVSAMAWGTGAALSNGVAGYVVDWPAMTRRSCSWPGAQRSLCWCCGGWCRKRAVGGIAWRALVPQPRHNRVAAASFGVVVARLKMIADPRCRASARSPQRRRSRCSGGRSRFVGCNNSNGGHSRR